MEFIMQKICKSHIIQWRYLLFLKEPEFEFLLPIITTTKLKKLVYEYMHEHVLRGSSIF